MHTPLTHICPAPQGMLQPPQLALSFFGFTQAPPQSIAPPPQPVHMPALHFCPLSHLTSQLPQ